MNKKISQEQAIELIRSDPEFLDCVIDAFKSRFGIDLSMSSESKRYIAEKLIRAIL